MYVDTVQLNKKYIFDFDLDSTFIYQNVLQHVFHGQEKFSNLTVTYI